MDYLSHYFSDWTPIEIRAVGEGAIIPTHSALITAVNTDPGFSG
jgi:hypothetical protein